MADPKTTKRAAAPLTPPEPEPDDVVHEATPGDSPDPSPVVPSTDTGTEPPEAPDPTPVTVSQAVEATATAAGVAVGPAVETLKETQRSRVEAEWEQAANRHQAFFTAPQRVTVPRSRVPATDVDKVGHGEQMVMLQREVEQLRDENRELRTDLAYARAMLAERFAAESAAAAASVAAQGGRVVTPTMPGSPSQVRDAPPTVQR